MWAEVFMAATSAAPLLTRVAPVRPAGTVAAEAVPDNASAEPAAPAASVTGTALAAVPRRAAGPGAPGLAWRASYPAVVLACSPERRDMVGIPDPSRVAYMTRPGQVQGLCQMISSGTAHRGAGACLAEDHRGAAAPAFAFLANYIRAGEHGL